jgi:hypothetical protein
VTTTSIRSALVGSALLWATSGTGRAPEPWGARWVNQKRRRDGPPERPAVRFSLRGVAGVDSDFYLMMGLVSSRAGSPLAISFEFFCSRNLRRLDGDDHGDAIRNFVQ